MGSVPHSYITHTRDSRRAKRKRTPARDTVMHHIKVKVTLRACYGNTVAMKG